MAGDSIACEPDKHLVRGLPTFNWTRILTQRQTPLSRITRRDENDSNCRVGLDCLRKRESAFAKFD